MGMFCYQCEQTSKSTGCTAMGVCGKDPDVAALQDLLVVAVKGIAQHAHRARRLGVTDRDVDVFVTDALFTTVTNVNFDAHRLAAQLHEAGVVLERARRLHAEACRAAGQALEAVAGAASWRPAADVQGLVRQGEAESIEGRVNGLGKDLAGLQELLTYGVKGTAAYAHHARTLGRESESFYAFQMEALDYLSQPKPTVKELFELCLRCGAVNLEVMELLDGANTGTYGHPVPTRVRVTPVQGKAILVSGHELKDLEELLKQTAGTGINVYTHGEMLPAHGYPELKKYPHLVGNYGGAWQDQRAEFDAFPGAILMTTNCIQLPKDTYKDRLFTSGLVAWPGVKHVEGHNYTQVLGAALAAPGFTRSEPERSILVGFGHQAVLSVAPQVTDAVKKGDIRRFFLIGGCDGAKTGRDYYTEFAEAVPQDCVMLTLACGKYRFNKGEYGDIGGIPRLLDCGQCNDAYSAIKIAGALAEAFKCGVNDLPLSMVLSWYEQKAVCILLTLLHLGIRHIRLGPSLPAFLSPNVLDVLVDKFAIKPITTVQQDLAAALAGA